MSSTTTTPGSGRIVDPASPRPSRTRSRLILAGMTAGAAIGYATFALARYADGRSTAFDLVIFDQAVRGYAALGAPRSAAKGVLHGFGPHFSVLGDHFSPILAVLAPAYWLFDDPRTLLIAQSLLFALAALPVWRFAERALGATPAHLVTAAYLLSWPIAAAVAFDFHEVAFAPLFTALLLERLQAGRRGQALAAAAALLLVKEDMGLLVAGVGVVLLLAGGPGSGLTGGTRRLGALLTAGGLVAAVLASRVVVPVLGGDAEFYWAYGRLGPDVPAVLAHLLTHPGDALGTLVTPSGKAYTLVLLLAPLAFLPLASPIVLAAVPLLAERMLADGFPTWWGVNYHYNAFVVVVLVLAGVDGARRLHGWWGRRRGRPALGWAAGVAVATVLLMPVFGYGQAFGADLWQRDAWARAAREASAVVPDGVDVAAADPAAAWLTARARVQVWAGADTRVPWVVADVARRHQSFDDVSAQRAAVRLLRGLGYRAVYERAGWVVLHRGPGR
ncbi:MAG: DUF2079 domain-containing protein [Streptosporangiales bacterium]|nr:DUF2079 domain-containing protein [Streptosporangiales bacterium]